MPAVGGQAEAEGVAGAFVGVHNGALIMAGGANFAPPRWDSDKTWHREIWLLERDGGDFADWKKVGELDVPVAYGAAVSTEAGIVCMGGNNAEQTFDEVFLLSWNGTEVVRKALPKLPQPLAYSSAALLEDKIYLAGGSTGHDLSTATKAFYVLDLSAQGQADFAWQVLPSWPGPARAYNLTIAQHNGQANGIYVLSGRHINAQGGTDFLKDMYIFNTQHYESGRGAEAWTKQSDAPASVMAGTAAAVGQSHIFVFGGDDGALFFMPDSLRPNHPGFPKETYAYHTITDRWVKAGPSPVNHVTTQAVQWGEDIIIPSGEVKPRTRSHRVWRVDIVKLPRQFGAINFTTLIIYLLLMLGVGVFFSFRNKNTEDFFRGGQRLPWWVAGLSIFATMLSSVTYMSLPAKAYATDWVFIFINLGAVLIAPFVIRYILPFFRRIDATSAYEYLEKRFNLFIRLFGSFSFVLYQIGRMAIVMFLPSLALAAILPLTVEQCILIMGVLSIIYCTLGGMEAVAWTDSIQTIVLLGGAVVSLVVILNSVDGGIAGFIDTAGAANKFHAINSNWAGSGFAQDAFWIILLGGIGQALIMYASDQSAIQRYMSVSSEKKAAQAIWTNAIMVVPATLLFFLVGAALYVYYNNFPQKLDPSFQTDAIFALFIARELPVGIAGLVVAGIFAAAQSTVSTSMNSTSTAVVTDFVRRFNGLKSEKAYFNLARLLTFGFGAIGTFFALLMANSDIKSLWDLMLSVFGLVGGPLTGLFLLGIFTKRANGPGAMVGVVLGIVALALAQQSTAVSFLLYSFIGIGVCFISGYLASFLFPVDTRSMQGLTIHDLPDK